MSTRLETKAYNHNPSNLSIEDIAIYLAIPIEKMDEENLDKKGDKPISNYNSGLVSISPEKVLPFFDSKHAGYLGYGNGYVPGEMANEAIFSIESGKTQDPPKSEEVGTGKIVPLNWIFPISCFPGTYGGPSAIFIQEAPKLNPEDLSPLLRPSERLPNSYNSLTLDLVLQPEKALKPIGLEAKANMSGKYHLN